MRGGSSEPGNRVTVQSSKIPIGTRVRYTGRRKRPEDRKQGEVIGERDAQGAWIKWDGGAIGSVLWDWIERVADPPADQGERSSKPGSL